MFSSGIISMYYVNFETLEKEEKYINVFKSISS